MTLASFTVEAFTLLGLAIVIILVRWAIRISTVGWRNLKGDDYLMILVVISYSIETTMGYSVGALWHGFANSGMTEEQRASLDPNSDEYKWRQGGSKNQVKGWTAYAFLLWTLKAAMCTFYLRLTNGLNGYRIRIYVGFGFLFISYITIACSLLFACRPFEKYWQIYPDPGNLCQPAVSKVNLFTMLVLNGTTEIYLILIPLPMLWMAQIPRRKKLGLLFIFSGGVFVTMAGTLRCVLILRNPVEGAEQSGNWACRESFVGVVMSNMPMIFPFIRRKIKGLSTNGSSAVTARYGDSAKHPGDPQPGSIRLDNMSSYPGVYKTDSPSTSSTCAIAKVTSDGYDDNTNEFDGIRKELEVHVNEEFRVRGNQNV